MTGLERINALFGERRAGKRAAFMPYHPMGYPSRDATLAIIKTLADAGADLFEIGIPHSDPLADGPVKVSFTPVLAPMPRGILATCSAPLAGPVTAEEAHA